MNSGITFLEVKMIETSIPQVVEQIIENLDKKKTVDVSLRLSKKDGFIFTIDNQGQRTSQKVPLKNGDLDYDGLRKVATEIKRAFPTTFALNIAPDKDLSMNEIVRALDQTRKLGATETVQVKDPESGQVVTTDLMFPNVAFSNTLGEN